MTIACAAQRCMLRMIIPKGTSKSQVLHVVVGVLAGRPVVEHQDDAGRPCRIRNRRKVMPPMHQVKPVARARAAASSSGAGAGRRSTRPAARGCGACPGSRGGRSSFHTYELLTMSNQPFFGSATRILRKLARSSVHDALSVPVNFRKAPGLSHSPLLDAVADAPCRLTIWPSSASGDLDALERARRRALEVGGDTFQPLGSRGTRAVAGALELVLGGQLARRAAEVRADRADGDEASRRSATIQKR